MDIQLEPGWARRLGLKIPKMSPIKGLLRDYRVQEPILQSQKNINSGTNPDPQTPPEILTSNTLQRLPEEPEELEQGFVGYHSILAKGP